MRRWWPGFVASPAPTLVWPPGRGEFAGVLSLLLNVAHPRRRLFAIIRWRAAAGEGADTVATPVRFCSCCAGDPGRLEVTCSRYRHQHRGWLRGRRRPARQPIPERSGRLYLASSSGAGCFDGEWLGVGELAAQGLAVGTGGGCGVDEVEQRVAEATRLRGVREVPSAVENF